MLYHINKNISEVLLNDEYDSEVIVEEYGHNFIGNISFNASILEITENEYINVNEPLEIDLKIDQEGFKFELYAFIKMQEDLIYRYYPTCYVVWHIARKLKELNSVLITSKNNIQAIELVGKNKVAAYLK